MNKHSIKLSDKIENIQRRISQTLKFKSRINKEINKFKSSGNVGLPLRVRFALCAYRRWMTGAGRARGGGRDGEGDREYFPRHSTPPLHSAVMAATTQPCQTTKMP